MENKKTIEKNCLEMTKNYISCTSISSRYILEILSCDVIEGERPDFLIENQSGTVGVEHFLIDTLIGKKKAARSRIRKSEIKRTFMSSIDQFDWVNFYKELSGKLLQYKGNRSELIEKVKKMPDIMRCFIMGLVQRKRNEQI